MIKKVIVTNYLGESLEMELARPEVSGLAITDIEGLGPVKATINTSEIATGDGALYNSAKLETRNIVMTLDLDSEQISKLLGILHISISLSRDTSR